MKHMIVLTCILSLMAFSISFGQSTKRIKRTDIMMNHNSQSKEKAQLIKIGIISKRLNLSAKQAERFWPLYNELTEKKKALRKKFKKTYTGLREDAGESEYKKLLDLGAELEQKKMDLENTYSKKMLTVISSKQVFELRLIERDMKKILYRGQGENGLKLKIHDIMSRQMHDMIPPMPRKFEFEEEFEFEGEFEIEECNEKDDD